MSHCSWFQEFQIARGNSIPQRGSPSVLSGHWFVPLATISRKLLVWHATTQEIKVMFYFSSVSVVGKENGLQTSIYLLSLPLWDFLSPLVTYIKTFAIQEDNLDIWLNLQHSDVLLSVIIKGKLFQLYIISGWWYFV